MAKTVIAAGRIGPRADGKGHEYALTVLKDDEARSGKTQATPLGRSRHGDLVYLDAMIYLTLAWKGDSDA